MNIKYKENESVMEQLDSLRKEGYSDRDIVIGLGQLYQDGMLSWRQFVFLFRKMGNTMSFEDEESLRKEFGIEKDPALDPHSPRYSVI